MLHEGNLEVFPLGFWKPSTPKGIVLKGYGCITHELQWGEVVGFLINQKDFKDTAQRF